MIFELMVTLFFGINYVMISELMVLVFAGAACRRISTSGGKASLPVIQTLLVTKENS